MDGPNDFCSIGGSRMLGLADRSILFIGRPLLGKGSVCSLFYQWLYRLAEIPGLEPPGFIQLGVLYR